MICVYCQFRAIKFYIIDIVVISASHVYNVISLGYLLVSLYIITSLSKEVMFLVALVSLSVCLSVCLFVCGQHYSKSYERIGMKFYGRVLSSTSKN